MTRPNHDPINPAHYRRGEVECIDAIRAALGDDGFLAYLRGSAIKYLWRAGHKNGTLEDLRKAYWFCHQATHHEAQREQRAADDRGD